LLLSAIVAEYLFFIYTSETVLSHLSLIRTHIF